MSNRPEFNHPDEWHSTDKPSGGSRALNILLVLAGGFLLLTLVCTGVFVLRLAQNDSLFEKLQSVEMPPADVETPDERRAALLAAFEAEEIGVDPPTLESIEDLFDEVIAACEKNDAEAVRRTIDFDRFLLQVKQAGIITAMMGLEESIFRNSLATNVDFSLIWRRYAIVHIDPTDAETEKVVTVFFWDTSDTSWPMRFWITRRGNGWKIYDWEYVFFGMRETVERAHYFEHDGDPRLENYYQGLQIIDAADNLLADSERVAAAEKLRSAEGERVMPQLADMFRLRLSFAWWRLDRPQPMAAVCRRIQSPRDVPGAYYNQAAAYDTLMHYRKVLEFAELYQESAGDDPDLLRMKAGALLAVGRTDDAVELWRKLLKYDPENYQALRSLADHLPEGQQQQLLTYLDNTDDPVQTATMLLNEFAVDPPGLGERLIEFVREKAPDSAKLAAAEATKQWSLENHEAAAGHYRRAYELEQDEDARKGYIDSYLTTMADAGKPVEGYQQAPDQITAFEHLAWLYEEGEAYFTAEGYRKLIEAHRRNHPDDPQLGYYSAGLLIEDEKYGKAEEELRAALESADEETAFSLRSQLISALYHQNRGLEAYRTIEPADETFNALAPLYLSDLKSRKEEFAQLMALHRRQQPEDWRLDLYAARIHIENREYDQAADLLQRDFGDEDEWYLGYQFRNALIDLYSRKGTLLEAYRKAGGTVEIFNLLADRFTQQQDWPNLQQLLAMRRQEHGDSPQVILREIEMLWGQEDYAAVIARLNPWPQILEDGLTQWELSPLREKLFRSYLRTGRADEAVKFAQEQYVQAGRAQAGVVAYAALDNAEKVEEFVEKYLVRHGTIGSLYSDDDVGEILLGEKYLPLRRRYPPDLPVDSSKLFIVLLLEEPGSMNAVQLRAAMAPLREDEITVNPLGTTTENDGPLSFELETGRTRFLLTFGSDRYFSAEMQPRKIRDEQLKQSLSEHAGWISISVAETEDWEDESQFLPACRITAQLADERTAAVWFPNEMRLLGRSTNLAQVLRNLKPRTTIEEWGEEAWIYRDAEADSSADESRAAARRRLPEFHSAFAEKTEAQSFSVQIELTLGSAREPNWIPVTRISRNRFGQMRYIGEFPTDSRLYPELKAGEPVSIARYEIIDWLVTDGEETVRGSEKRQQFGSPDVQIPGI